MWRRSPVAGTSALVLGTGTTVAKLAAAVLSLAFVRPLGRRLARVVPRVARAVGAVLTICGLAQVVVGGLALSGMTGGSPVDPTPLRWHVLVWDPWFPLWGLLLGAAATHERSASRSDRPDP